MFSANALRSSRLMLAVVAVAVDFSPALADARVREV
jgi:hypothetical protein